MPPADNLPDFDSMSPEELQAWMETLAERQGADEGFITDQRMEIAEVDPDSVEDSGPGYIPYGMDEETWAKKQAEEAERKAARAAQRQQAQPPAQPAVPEEPAPPVEPPAAEPVAPAQPAASGGEPDFDSMSPEQLMAWMETLAERQGASEGFTTQERMEIAEVDPDSVEDSGPGYIPYGMDEETWAKKQAEEAARRAAGRPASPVPTQAEIPVEAEPEAEPEPEADQFELPQLDLDLEATTDMTPPADADDGMAWLESLAAEQGGEFPEMDLSGLGSELENFDLEGLPGADEVAEEANPMQWLDGLVQEQESAFDLPTGDLSDSEVIGDLPPAQPEPTTAQPMPESAGDDDSSLEWLESLAKKQGASEEEFTTPAGMSIEDDDDYQESEMFTAPEPAAPVDLDALDVDDLDSADPDDPAAWLETLAASQGAEAASPPDFLSQMAAGDEQADEEEDEQPQPAAAASDDIIHKLNAAEDVSPDDMKGWMDNLLEQGASRTDVPDYIDEDEDDEPLEAQIPDWLVEQVGPPPDLSAEAAVEPAAEMPLPEFPTEDDVAEAAPDMPELDLDEADEAVDLPDWLTEDLETDDAAEDLENIFAASAEAEPAEAGTSPVISPPTEIDMEIDTSDPWVEAFELERQHGLDDISNIPDWYKEKLGQQPAASAEAVDLQAADFAPESVLPHGEPEALPDWLGAVQPPSTTIDAAPAAPEPVAEEAAEELAAAEMPDWLADQVAGAGADSDDDDLPEWLKEAGVEQAESVPDWLMETVTEEHQAVSSEPEPSQPAPPTPAPAPAPTPQPAVSPAPVPVSDIDVEAALQAAREKVSGNEVEVGLQSYELVVRANAHLEDVVNDLTTLTKQERYKSNAGIHRVLGDGLMRQGRLQEALDTYRRALNLL